MVSNAGGLGILITLTKRRCDKATGELVDRNFGPNATLLPSISPSNYEERVRTVVEGVKVFETAGNNREHSLCFRFPSFGGRLWSN